MIFGKSILKILDEFKEWNGHALITSLKDSIHPLCIFDKRIRISKT